MKKLKNILSVVATPLIFIYICKQLNILIFHKYISESLIYFIAGVICIRIYKDLMDKK